MSHSTDDHPPQDLSSPAPVSPAGGGPEAEACSDWDSGRDPDADTTWRRLEPVIAGFEAAYWRSERPDIAEFLPADTSDRAALLPELVHAEIELRLKAGESVNLQDYLRRYPELADDSSLVARLSAAEFQSTPRDGTTSAVTTQKVSERPGVATGQVAERDRVDPALPGWAIPPGRGDRPRRVRRCLPGVRYRTCPNRGGEAAPPRPPGHPGGSRATSP